MVGTLSRLIMAALLCLLPLGALAQTPAAASSQALLKPAELDQLVAPIALYPDALLSEVLIASTYPLEVVQADRWAKSNNSLKGEALTAALAKQGYDPLGGSRQEFGAFIQDEIEKWGKVVATFGPVEQ